MAGHEAGRSSAGENSLEGENDAEAHPCGRRRRGVVRPFAGPVQAQQKTISIGTGGTGGVYYPLGGAVASVLSKHLPGVQATAEVTGGSVDNLKLIGTGQSEIGFSMADAALDAAQGQDKFKSGKVNLKTLMVLYPNRMHVVTIEGTGIEKMADLKGKRVSTGSPGGATEVMAFRVIEAPASTRTRT
jgi:TRAP transporter TAXI family solute receptor